METKHQNISHNSTSQMKKNKVNVGLPFIFPLVLNSPTGYWHELPRCIPEIVHLHDQYKNQNFPDSPAFVWPIKNLVMLLQLMMKAKEAHFSFLIQECDFFQVDRALNLLFFRLVIQKRNTLLQEASFPTSLITVLILKKSKSPHLRFAIPEPK